jgi:hypothetical protein
MAKKLRRVGGYGVRTIGIWAMTASWALIVSLGQPVDSKTSMSPMTFAETKAAPSTATGNPPIAQTCKQVCVKSKAGNAKVPAQCLQWQTIC